MLSLALVIAAISLASWLFLLFAWGNFWNLHPFDDDEARHTAPPAWPTVTAIIPARNESETIREAVASLLQQNYLGKFSIVVVDDHSEDGTAKLAQESANRIPSGTAALKVLSALPLQPGWTGKLSALNEGVRSISDQPTYLWFTDADIVHSPDTLTRLVARAEYQKLDLNSLMVLLRAQTLPEKFLIPPFLFFFLMLYPPAKIANPKSKTAGAAGGCILLRRDALERIGGLAAIRSEVIDDCALARAVKRSRPEGQRANVWMGLTRKSRSLRAYTTFAEIRDMIARTAFTQLNYSAILLIGTLLGLAITYLAPIALLFAHDTLTRILALSTWLLMSLLFLPTVRFYRISTHWAATLPAVAAFYAAATTLSAFRYWTNRGAQWKGRSQAPR
ncbi:MAG: glycosyltransferase [Acidobacteria bacterium]|nr:glycosyltransferase [Acidobacteriota bacterium]